MSKNRERNTLEQWNDVLRGLSVSQAKRELQGTTLQIKVVQINKTVKPDQQVGSFSQQKYIHVAVLDYQNYDRESSVIVNVLYIDP